MTRALLLLLLCLWPPLLWSAVGKLDSFEGDVKISSKSGFRTVAAGLEVDEGDLVRTGANAWALFEMSDGASITVRPATELRITKYRYSQDGAASQNSSVIDLAKGALRVITGLIGQTNRPGYAINTPTATMGIRGTDHEPAYIPTGTPTDKDQQPGAYDKVNEGETFIRNEKGQQVIVGRGRVAYMSHDRRTAPKLLQGEPGFYRRHAEIDRRVAARREVMHRRIQEQRTLRQHERQDKMQKRQEDKKAAPDQKKAGRQEQQAHPKPRPDGKHETADAKRDGKADHDKGEREKGQKKLQDKRDQRKQEQEQRRNEKGG